ncbi:MAG: hypothetical protein ACOY16_00455 [Chloroflexota bacterium]
MRYFALSSLLQNDMVWMMCQRQAVFFNLKARISSTKVVSRRLAGQRAKEDWFVDPPV